MLSRLNHTQVPNDFIDTHMRTVSSTAGIIFLCICRKTIGWHKETDSISVSQLEKLTGRSKNTILSAIKELEGIGLIIKESHMIENVNLPNTYTINFSTLDAGARVVQESHGGGAENARGGGAENAPTKETITKENTKETHTRIKNEELFTEFWETYNKKSDKQLALKQWNRLTKDQQIKAISNIKPYLASLSDIKYQKKPSNYLAHGTFEDDFSSKQPAFKDYG